jgi:hypothetical protein
MDFEAMCGKRIYSAVAGLVGAFAAQAAAGRWEVRPSASSLPGLKLAHHHPQFTWTPPLYFLYPRIPIVSFGSSRAPKVASPGYPTLP